MMAEVSWATSTSYCEARLLPVCEFLDLYDQLSDIGNELEKKRNS